MGRMICAYGCVLPVWHFLCGAIAGAAGVEPPDFSVSGSAFLQKYCLKCHNDQESSAELSLQGLTDNAALIRSRRSVTRILRVVTSGEMPPADQQRPELA
ncbi:MAG: c-type cytochrome domain-containing protein [Planctomyces sp.]